MNTTELEQKAEYVSGFLKLLASAPRLMILCQLTDGERAVGELSEATGLRMSAVSQHMALLRAQSIVATRRSGTTIYYSLANDTMKDLIGLLHDKFCKEDEKSA
ncbi:ArsR/SmtB family transcription factor [Coralliovum pocilloporae]|uniref:ArsR/SmtB family transcription factor n=1 Tax=Coralliovum pocilloporae TaxID=3066369 RepID=UPI0033079E89